MHNFFKEDHELVRKRLKEKNSASKIKNGMKVSDAWRKFTEVMREIIEENIPNNKGINKRWPWYT